MAGTDILNAVHMDPKVLYSGQLADAADHLLYAPAAGASAIVKHGTVCNVSGASVNVTVRVIPSGGSVDGSHTVISAYPLAAGDTLPLGDYLDGCCLGPGDAVHVQASAGGAVDVVLSGVENT